MYKAIDSQTGSEIIILHPDWRSKLNTLREMDHRDVLVCQGCGQPVRVKAGEVKRPHFAHKHLKACSLGIESPEIMLGRAVLYEFLLQYFRQGVTLEKHLEGQNLPRPVDCWIETPTGHLAYWIVDSGIKLEPREAINSGLTRSDIHPTWVLLAGLMNEEKRLFNSILLTPTERAFLQSSPYDECLAAVGRAGGSLHYLDAEQATMITYRNLALHHRPNWFHGLKKTTPLSDLLVDRQTGGFIHPGEEKRRAAFIRQRDRLERKRTEAAAREQNWEQKLSERGDPFTFAPKKDPVKLNLDDAAGPAALVCVQCGQVTVDYWMTFINENGERVCRCRACLDRL